MRLQADHVNRSLVPAFYRYLQAQTEEKQIEGGKEFHVALEGLVNLLERAEREIIDPGGVSGEGEAKMLQKGLGLWVPGQKDLGWADIMAGPCPYQGIFRLERALVEFPQGYSGQSWCLPITGDSKCPMASASMDGWPAFSNTLPSRRRAAPNSCILIAMRGWCAFHFIPIVALNLEFVRHCRYAFNRPNTSMVATAINEGRTLP